MASIEASTVGPEDADAIVALNDRVFGTQDMTGWRGHQLEAHTEIFPEGQFLVRLDGSVVGSATSFLVDREDALAPHTWMSITGGCKLPNHDPDGDCLYGLEIMVDPAARGLGLASLLYRLRKVLAREMNLWGIVLGGRIPGYAQAARREPSLTPERYAREVVEGKREDPVLSVQAACGFEPEGVLENYVRDPRSEHHGIRMVWRT